jgi:phage gpG-like protein
MIKATLQGVEQLQRQLAALRQRGDNLKPLQREIAGIMHDEVELNFQSGGRDPKWKVSKRAEKKGGQTLIDSTQLRNSIQEFIMANSAGVATNKEYAAIHNFGGDIVRHPFSMPVRLRTTNAKGNLLRQGKEGLLANLAVFARKGHKRAVTRWYTSSGYTIHMEQREFMKVSAGGIGQIEAAAAAFITP